MKLKKRISIIFIALLSVLIIIPSAFSYSVSITGPVVPVSSLDIHGFTFWFDVSNDFAFSNFSFGSAIPSGGTLGWSQDPAPNIDVATLKVGGVDQDFLFLDTQGLQMTDGTILSFDIDAGSITPLGSGLSDLIQFDPGDGSNIFNDSVFLLSSDSNSANFSTVPIPPTVLLLGAGLMGLVGIRRRVKS